jgi:hypothetical protein
MRSPDLDLFSSSAVDLRHGWYEAPLPDFSPLIPAVPTYSRQYCSSHTPSAERHALYSSNLLPELATRCAFENLVLARVSWLASYQFLRLLESLSARAFKIRVAASRTDVFRQSHRQFHPKAAHPRAQTLVSPFRLIQRWALVSLAAAGRRYT